MSRRIRHRTEWTARATDAQEPADDLVAASTTTPVKGHVQKPASPDQLVTAEAQDHKAPHGTGKAHAEQGAAAGHSSGDRTTPNSASADVAVGTVVRGGDGQREVSLERDELARLVAALLVRNEGHSPSPATVTGIPLLRALLPPVDDRDLFERLEMAATETGDRADRFERRSRDRRRDKTHGAVLLMTVVTVLAVIAVVGVIVLSRYLPHTSPAAATKIMVSIIVGVTGTIGSGYGIRRGARAWKGRRSSGR